MNGLLLTTASAIALVSATAFGATPAFKPFDLSKTLYGQNSNDAGSYINSQNFSTTYFSDQGADDFVVPKGQAWRITEVDVTGVYFNGSGAATSENVIFYKNMDGTPGNPVKKGTFTNLNGSGGPNFALVLPGGGFRLTAGKYWVEVDPSVRTTVAGILIGSSAVPFFS